MSKKTSQIISIVILVAVVLIHLGQKAYMKTQIEQLQRMNNILQSDIELRVKEKIYEEKRRVTDSLLNDFNSKPPVSEIIQIEKIIRNEKIDSIIGLPMDDRIRFIANYLDTFQLAD